MRVVVVVSGLAVFGCLVSSACGDSPQLCDNRACEVPDGGADANLDGSVDGRVDAPADCDLTKDPKDSPSCVDDGVGVFVSPTGSDSNTGTKASPVKTLATALTKLGGKPRIYVCEGNYPGSVEIKSSVSIYGALKCDWTLGGARPVIQADKPAFGLQLEASNISLVDLEVDGADGVADGESSIAIVANSAPSAMLTRAKVVAGNGKNGKAGTTGSNYTTLLDQSDPSIAGSDVKMGMPTVGGAPHACMLCTDGNNSSGGGGGNGTLAPTDGQDGLPNLNGVNPIDGKGGAKDIGSGCKNGDKGPSGDAGVSAAVVTVVATVDLLGWQPSGGSKGINGSVAQGGGGGGGGISSSKGGAGGGGCGGCGGGSGTGGTGGGASIGLLSVSSSVTLVTSEVTSKQAGNGGNGAAGQTGQLGGAGGTQASLGCPGGTGGTGGLGGSGSGGAGGVSAPIVFKGSAPTMDSATTGKLFPGTKGTKGTGGTPGTNDGPDGLSQPTFECKTPLCN